MRKIFIQFFFIFPLLLTLMPNLLHADDDYLSTKALKQLLQDKTAYAHTLKDKTKWQLKFQDDGQAVFTYSNGTSKTVVYRIENGSICMDFSAETKNICRKLSRTVNGYLWVNTKTGQSNSEIFEIKGEEFLTDKNVFPKKITNEKLLNTHENTEQKIKILPQLGQKNIKFVGEALDGEVIVSGGENSLKFWDAASGHLLRNIVIDNIRSFAISPKREYIATGQLNRNIKIWKIKTGELLYTLKGHDNLVGSLAFSPNGNQLISGNGPDIDGVMGANVAEGYIKVWSVDSGRLLKTLKHDIEELNSLDFSEDGKYILASGFDRIATGRQTVRIYDSKNQKLIRSYLGNKNSIVVSEFSPKNNIFVTGNWGGEIEIWDTKTGKIIRSFMGHKGGVSSIKVSKKGDHFLSSGTDKTIKLWNISTGKLIMTFKGHKKHVSYAIFSSDGRQIISSSGDGTIRFWKISTGKTTQTIKGFSREISSPIFSYNKKMIVSASENKFLVWDLIAGRKLLEVNAHKNRLRAIGLSSNDKYIVTTDDWAVKLWDSNTGANINKFSTLNDSNDYSSEITAVAISSDAKSVVTGHVHSVDLELWNAKTGKHLRTYKVKKGVRPPSDAFVSVFSVTFSSDQHKLLSINSSGQIILWDSKSGKHLLTIADKILWSSVKFSESNNEIVAHASLNNQKIVKIWDIKTGNLLKKYKSKKAYSTMSMDGSLQALIQDNGIEINASKTGKTISTFYNFSKKDWIAITPEGFFNSSSKINNYLNIVKGFESFDIRQVYDHLYRPDLIKEALSGDKFGKLKDAAYKLNLEKIMASGPAPQLELKTPKTELVGSSVKLSVRVTDTGGGISNKIIWRVNGKTQGNVQIPGGPIEDAVTVTQGLQIDPRQKNIITVTAYNEAGLLASAPLEITVDNQGATVGDRPRMHVLSIGIDKYEQSGYQLNYAVGDASAVGKMLKTVASSLYDKVEVTYLTDKEVTRDGLDQAFSKIAPKVRPQDVFILYVAGHGKSLAGTYYYLPQDLSFKAGHGILTHGIGQDLWQKWLAKITANKSVLIFDTCESTEATKIRSATNIERETALDRLRHAHGHSSITAARQAAFEGYKGHGVLTYTILEALSKTAEGKKKEVDLSDLAKHINLRVPVISKQEYGSIQRPHNKIVGDFPFGITTKGVLKAAKETIPKTPTHVIIQSVRLSEKAEKGFEGKRRFVPGKQIRVVKFFGDWAQIASDGTKIGYVPVKTIAKIIK
ncbi:MAG: caspase family protein [Rhodomicrobiaceae bacterium]